MKKITGSSLAAAALFAAATSASCEGTTELDREAAKREAAQEYGGCLLEKYYENPRTNARIQTALDKCEEQGRKYATYLVKDYKSNFSDVRYNVQSYMYPVVRRQGSELLENMVQE